MRAARGWLAAVLLAAVVLVGGPDLLESVRSQPRATAAQTLDATTRSAVRVADEAARSTDASGRATDPAARPGRTSTRAVPPSGGDSRHRSADRDTSNHRVLPGLPVSSQSQFSAPAKDAGSEHHLASTPAVADPGRRWHGEACSPETLQIFRC